MLEVRERFLQISQFFRAGISVHTILPGTMRPRLEGVWRQMRMQRIGAIDRGQAAVPAGCP